jgi:hypothetical protein
MDLTPLLTIRRAQLGVWTRAQALAVGLTHPTLRAWVAAGAITELYPGTFVESGPPVRWEVRALAAQLRVGGEAALARSSAVRLLAMRGPRRLHRAPIELVVHDRTPALLPGLVVHRTSRPLDRWVTGLDPHRVTAAARTICELAGSLTPLELRRLVSHAVRTKRTTPDELREALAWHGRIRGATALRKVLDELAPLEAHTRSELESFFLRVARTAGLSPDVVNHPVVDAHGDTRMLDAAYLPEHLPIELDSHLEHGTLLDWNDDTRRANRIILRGPWRPFLRFSWDDLARYPTQVIDHIWLALRAAGTTR